MGPSRLRILAEIVAVLAVLPAVKLGAEQFGLEFAGPVGTVAALALASLFLKRRGLTWGDLGLVWPTSWLRTIGWGVLAFVGSFLLAGVLAQAVTSAMGAPPTDLSAFKDVEGNVLRLAGWLAVAWLIGGLSEELLARGFLLNGLADVFGEGRGRLYLAAVLQAVIFGLGHAYQGVSGIVATACVGLVLGLVYVRCGRSLVPVILAHGAVDSVSFVAIYFGALA